MTRFDPDPRYVEPEPVRRLPPPPQPDGAGVTVLALTFAAIVAIAIAALVLRAAAPRPGPDPTTPQPGVSDAAGFVRASAPVQVGTSGPSQGTQPGRVAALGPATYSGFAGWAVPSLGREYLALREPRGTVATICGPGGCWRHARSTEYGPSSRIRPARVADIAVGHWELVCGVPRSFGLCDVTVTIERRDEPLPTAPRTDVSP